MMSVLRHFRTLCLEACHQLSSSALKVHAGYVIVFLLFVITIFVAFQAGAVKITIHDWYELFSAAYPIGSSNHDKVSLSGNAYVLWHLRIPRVLLAMLVGAALGLSGSLVQGLFRNPLADTSLLGVTSGAACAAALTIVVLAEYSHFLSVEARSWLLPIVSFMGALLTCVFLNVGARWFIHASVAGLLLFGIAINALGVAVIGLCTYLATDEQLRSLSFWTLGSFAGANWLLVMTLSLILVIAYLSSQTLASHLNALSLGESTAAHLGIDIPRLRWFVSIVVALLAGLSVAFCGVIGFVGLIAPHLARSFVGADQRMLLPLSMLAGGLLLLVADTMARTIVIPAEVPVGIFTALLGGPFLMLLLRTKRDRMG